MENEPGQLTPPSVDVTEPALAFDQTVEPEPHAPASENEHTLLETPTSPTEPDLEPPAKKSENWLFFGLKMAVLALVIFLVTQLVVPPYIVRGMSMEPNYHTGERLITDKAVFKLLGHPQRDDVIILNEPNSSEVLIKRVIGLPGDTVEVSHNTVYINGSPLDEPFIEHKADYTLEPETVPPNQYFVMGDNRSNSLDSHLFGFVPADKIIARVWFKIF